MPLINRLQVRLQNHPKRVVFPEGADARVLQAARQFATRRLGVPILIGDRLKIKNRAERLDVRLDGIRIIEPERSEDFDLLLDHMEGLEAFARVGRDTLRQLLATNTYFATLLLATGRADAMVSGALAAGSGTLRILFKVIPRQEFVKTVHSMVILDFDESPYGINGTLFLADCGVIPNPTDHQLADISLSTGMIARHLTNELPRVALLSYQTRGDSQACPESLLKVREATLLARKKASRLGIDIAVDGELQVDAALDPFAARQKNVEDSKVAGKANVLVFPDLNSGNIGFMMAQVLVGARTYGQILLGLSRPVGEISRGASAHDIFGTAVIVSCQAVDRRFLYPSEIHQDW